MYVNKLVLYIQRFILNVSRRFAVHRSSVVNLRESDSDGEFVYFYVLILIFIMLALMKKGTD